MVADDIPVFDAHTHIGEWGAWEMAGNRVDPFTDPITSRDALAAQMERHGVNRQVVMPHYHPDRSLTYTGNHLAVDLARLDGVVAAIFATPDDPHRLDDIRDLATDPDVRALKTSADAWDDGSYDPSTWTTDQEEMMAELLRLARQHDLPVHCHTGSDASDPRALFALIDRYPDVTYHCVHMGGTAAGHFAFVPRFCDRLDLDVYADTSWARGFGVRWLVRELRERDALDRLMFASDEPWGDRPGELATVRGLDLDRDEERAVLHDTAARLYGDR